MIGVCGAEATQRGRVARAEVESTRAERAATATSAGDTLRPSIPTTGITPDNLSDTFSGMHKADRMSKTNLFDTAERTSAAATQIQAHVRGNKGRQDIQCDPSISF